MADLSGKYVGRYHILEQLGQGGMAVVYKAYDTRLEREVALKVIRVDMVQPAHLENMLKRFEREAKSLARMEHSSIVNVHDYGEHEGAPYLVMQYLRGGTLKQRTGRPVPYAEAARLLLPVARALEYAHRRNVIHRDVKPANIFLARRRRRFDHVKLLDFGLVKAVGPVEPSDAALTVEGIAVGTPAFIAPEMAEAAPGVDGRADIYSLGCVAYWLLTGRLVFTGSPMQVMMDHIRKRPEPPSGRTELAVPPDLERVIMHCLEKDRRDRPRTVGDLADALTACESAGLWTPERAREWWETNAPVSLIKASAAERVMGGPTPAGRV